MRLTDDYGLFKKNNYVKKILKIREWEGITKGIECIARTKETSNVDPQMLQQTTWTLVAPRITSD